MNEFADLTGKKIGSWYVVAYAGVRDRLHYWRCMCRYEWFMVEKVVAERDILDKTLNTLNSYQDWKHHCWRENPSGWIYGEWTVIGPTSQSEAGGAEPLTLWRCRCVCGVERDITQTDLTEWRTLSCGCRLDADVRYELYLKRAQAFRGFAKERSSARHAANRQASSHNLDKNWTRNLENALRSFQAACVNCGATNHLTTHHVQPLSGGHGLEPGNAVRLCRACNSFIGSRKPSELSSDQARKIETAAAQFKEFLENGCATPEAHTVASTEETPQTHDPILIALLRAVECGEKTAISALATWLEERRDPRSSAISALTTWSKPSDEVWCRLGLSHTQRETLRQYICMGLMCGGAATIEEIAQRQGKQVQTIRNRIDLAFHLLTVPSQKGHHEG